MWALYLKATKFSKAPSACFPGLTDEWAAYCFDNAVLYLGMTVENALHERDEVGTGNARRSMPRYTLKQLLDETFRLPRHDEEDSLEGFRGMDGAFYDEVT